MQRTLALFRPAAVESGLAHKLLSCAVETGMRVSLRKTLLLSVKVWLGFVSAPEDCYLRRLSRFMSCVGCGAIPSPCMLFPPSAFASTGCT